ncbi:hypothetical protein R1flu_004061 [Riccia fluitans]|uniref:Uncharacterized protein n=1 Tax=Riccia fluitans TaxID=41844 RepID=A0ABD1YP87_9MARC
MARNPVTFLPVRYLQTPGPVNTVLFLLPRRELKVARLTMRSIFEHLRISCKLSGGNVMTRSSGGPVSVASVAPSNGILRFQLNFRRGIRTSVAWSALKKLSLEPQAKILEQKASWKPRHRSTKPKATNGVETEESSSLQKPRLEVETWSRIKTWIVFSDLHVSRRTLETCLHVLRAVHAEASSRDGGIIFLGDFWHARGALPVELLNVVIQELATWSCPAIFIPGNHDQVNMGGQMHALMVLGAVNPLIRVFDEPVEFLDALWMPYRRDQNIINQTLQQHPTVKAIFAHLDVVGAYMNEACQAKEGVDPAIFPENIPIFTGHYHKPHIVDNTLIEYIGSPYQVSASESGQSKRFLLLDSSWKKIGSVSIDIGGRHFVISDIEKTDLEEMQHVRSGDRIRLLLSTTLLEDTTKRKLETLQNSGVQVDLVFPALLAKPRIEEAESLDAVGLFKLYAERVGMTSGAVTEGVRLLQSMDLPAKLIQRPQVQLALQNIEIQGFGPYLQPVKYPLSQRGIRVICGRNMDSVGADSNGAGKSTLVMAPLWALSGSTDPRPDSMRGLSASDVIHEKAKIARVYVQGTVNGKTFTVERVAGRKPSLKFIYDGEDCTGQDMKLTQEKIDEIIDTSVLQRVAFHGQYGIGGLLEASDKDFKEELSKVVAMDLWVAAKKQSLQDLRSKQTEVELLEGAMTQLRQQGMEIGKKVEESKKRMENWERNWAHRCTVLEQEAEVAAREFESLILEFGTQYRHFLKSSSDLENIALQLEREIAMSENGDTVVNHEIAEAEKKRREMLLAKAAELAVEVRTYNSVLNTKKQGLDDYRKNISGRQICEKCLQTIDSSHSTQKIFQLEDDISCSEEEYKLLVKECSKNEEELQRVTKIITQETQKHEEASIYRWRKSVELRDKVNQLRQCLTVAAAVSTSAAHFLAANGASHSGFKDEDMQTLISRNKQEGDSCELVMSTMEEKGQALRKTRNQLESCIHEGLRRSSKLEQLRQSLYGLRSSDNPFKAEYRALESVFETIETSIVEKQRSYEIAEKYTGWLKELDSAFSHSGVQSYILEGALAELQERTARYLDVLSGGSLGLLLRPTKENKRFRASVEAIDRVAMVRRSTGLTEQRSLRQLSGGERRRLALAVALGFAEFAAQRSGLHCDLLVLDEVLQHLDSEGKARVVSVLKGLPQGTVLLVSQTYGDVADYFDLVDIVVKENDTVRIESPV